MFLSFISLSFSLYLLSFLPARTCMGVAYSVTTNTNTKAPPPPPDNTATTIDTLNLASLRLEDSDPVIIRSFLHTNITLFLTIPNNLVSPIAVNRSNALRRLYTHVVPFSPRANITAISVGNSFADFYPESIDNLLPAIRNVHLSLRELGIPKISVSTSFSFVTAVSTPFPPSSAQFQEPSGVSLMGPLLQFLSETNSSFLINVYSYDLYGLNLGIPIGIALFQVP